MEYGRVRATSLSFEASAIFEDSAVVDYEMWYKFFFMKGYKCTKLDVLLNETLCYFKKHYSFLSDAQILGKAYSKLGIPHFCGKVNKRCLQHQMKKEIQSQRKKLKIAIKHMRDRCTPLKNCVQNKVKVAGEEEMEMRTLTSINKIIDEWNLSADLENICIEDQKSKFQSQECKKKKLRVTFGTTEIMNRTFDDESFEPIQQQNDIQRTDPNVRHTHEASQESDASSVSSGDTCWDTGLMSGESEDDSQAVNIENYNNQGKNDHVDCDLNCSTCIENMETQDFETTKAQMLLQPEISSEFSLNRNEPNIAGAASNDEIFLSKKLCESNTTFLITGNYYSLDDNSIDCNGVMQSTLDLKEEIQITTLSELNTKTTPSYSEMIENYSDMEVFEALEDQNVNDSLRVKEYNPPLKPSGIPTDVFVSDDNEYSSIEEQLSKGSSPKSVHISWPPSPYDDNSELFTLPATNISEGSIEMKEGATKLSTSNEIVNCFNDVAAINQLERSDDVFCSSDDDFEEQCQNLTLDGSILKNVSNDFNSLREAISEAINYKNFEGNNNIDEEPTREKHFCEKLETNNNEDNSCDRSIIDNETSSQLKLNHGKKMNVSEIIQSPDIIKTSANRNKSSESLTVVNSNLSKTGGIGTSDLLRSSITISRFPTVNPPSHCFPLAFESENPPDAQMNSSKLFSNRSCLISVSCLTRNENDVSSFSLDQEGCKLRQETDSNGTLFESANSTSHKELLGSNAFVCAKTKSDFNEFVHKKCRKSKLGSIQKPSQVVEVKNKFDDLDNIDTIESSFSMLSVGTDVPHLGQASDKLPYLNENDTVRDVNSNASQTNENSHPLGIVNCTDLSSSKLPDRGDKSKLCDGSRNCDILFCQHNSSKPVTLDNKSRLGSATSTFQSSKIFDQSLNKIESDMVPNDNSRWKSMTGCSHNKSANPENQLDRNRFLLNNKIFGVNLRELSGLNLNYESPLNTSIGSAKTDLTQKISLFSDKKLNPEDEGGDPKRCSVTVSSVPKFSGSKEREKDLIEASESVSDKIKYKKRVIVKPSSSKSPQKKLKLSLGTKELNVKYKQVVTENLITESFQPLIEKRQLSSSQNNLFSSSPNESLDETKSNSIISPSSFEWPKKKFCLSSEVKSFDKNANCSNQNFNLSERETKTVASSLKIDSSKVNTNELNDSYIKEPLVPGLSKQLFNISSIKKISCDEIEASQIKRTENEKQSFERPEHCSKSKEHNPTFLRVSKSKQASKYETSDSSLIQNSISEEPPSLSLPLSNKVDKEYVSDIMFNYKNDGDFKGNVKMPNIWRHSVSDCIKNSQENKNSSRHNSLEDNTIDEELQKKFDDYLSGSLGSVPEEPAQSQQNDVSQDERYVDDETLLLRRRAFYI